MINTNNFLKILALSVGMAATAPSAFAQGFGTVHLSNAPNDNGGMLGAAVIATYQYRGSDERRALLLPVLDYQWISGWFAGTSNGIGYNFSQSAQLQYGLRLTADDGRKVKRANALRGMGDVKAAAEGGAFFNYSPIQGLFLNSSIRYGAGSDRKGLLVNLGADYSTAIAANWYINVGTEVTLANANYMQSFFGVTSAQSSASGYATQLIGSGARDVRAKVAMTYAIDQKISVTGAISLSRLLNDAKDSALTHKRTSGTSAIVINYAF